MKGTLADLIARHAGAGRIDWIGVRPGRLASVSSVVNAEIGPSGLSGDHARPGKRAVTLIQAEHLAVIAALSRLSQVRPSDLRRNLVVSGINLGALAGVPLRVGGAVLRITGPCAPCSRMEAVLGPGGYSAMRGHGGVTAEVVMPGRVAMGDAVTPADA